MVWARWGGGRGTDIHTVPMGVQIGTTALKVNLAKGR